MKRILITDMPWKEIQTEYDLGMSIRTLCEKRGMATRTVIKASKLGLFKSRSLSDAGRISQSLKPRDYSMTRKNRPALTNYRADCAFKFNLADYPEEFDFVLIETYGWYKPKNKGNNLTGVSRDHAVSVRYGFDNNLPAEHLSHPANCVIMQHGKNSSKGKNNTMSYEELLKRIETWDIKYNSGAAEGCGVALQAS